MHLNITRVTAPSVGRRWVKAVAELTADQLQVSDRRGVVILEILAPRVDLEKGPAGQRRWQYADVIVEDMPGACTCGGMTIQDVPLEMAKEG